MRKAAIQNAVPIMFAVICLFASLASGLRLEFLLSELAVRLGRNLLLVLSLIVPITAGLGLNFSIVLGAMAAQVALITVVHMNSPGLFGLVIAFVLSTPIAVLFGYLASRVLNKARGKEMITAMILGFFADGLYQLVLLFMVGSIIPVKSPELLLESGVGVRSTVDLQIIANSLDKLLPISFGQITIPLANLLVVASIAYGMVVLSRTKLGQDMRAVGQDLHVAQMAGINVSRIRIIAVVISTVMACWGHIIFLQNITTLNTYYSHDQVGMFSIAALLVGGATVSRATWVNAVVGTVLFHTLFVVAPFAGQRLLESPQIGEYFRVFVAYAIIAASLAMNAWQRRAAQTDSRASAMPATPGATVKTA